MGKNLERAIGILNGLVGDYLERSENGLATPFGLVHEGDPLELSQEALRRKIPDARSRVVVLVHGLMCTETSFAFDEGGDLGASLARDHDLTPLYVRYNTGNAIAESGARLSVLLDKLLAVYPVPIEEIVLLGHSMGGLVIRSACHVASEAKLAWLSRAKTAVYLGTPHRGAPLERVGRVATEILRTVPDPYTRLIGQISDLRSGGVKALGDAELRAGDAEGRRFNLTDRAHPVPLLPGIEHHLVAGTLHPDPWLTLFFGDSIVPLVSATDGEKTAKATLLGSVEIFHGVSHMRLACDASVYAHVSEILRKRRK